jgi:transcriptional regulator with XRE-family HTH domain
VKNQSAIKPSLQQQFGAHVRSLRMQKGLSQTDLAVNCGFYQTYLSRIEQGKANPTLNAIEVIANALGLTVFELFARIKTGIN